MIRTEMPRSITRQTRSLTTVLALGLGAGAACDTSDFITYDLLRVEAKVVANDGFSPVPGLPIQDYRWIVNYQDGSTVSMPFGTLPPTDAQGGFRFSSGNLELQSGNPILRGCTDVCVETTTVYDFGCVLQESYSQDYCVEWTYDSQGNAICTDWETEYWTECAAYGQIPRSYCSVWAEDCTYTYPDRSVSDIRTTQSEIDYRLGSTFMTTLSQGVSGMGYSTVQSSKRSESLQWLEQPTFVTPIPAVAGSQPQVGQKSSALKAELTAEQKRIVQKRNAKKKPVVREVKGNASGSFSHPPAKRISSDRLHVLTQSQAKEFEKARQAFIQSQQQQK